VKWRFRKSVPGLEVVWFIRRRMPSGVDTEKSERHSMTRSGRKRILFLWVVGALGLVLSGCASETSEGADERLHVVVTVAPLAGLVDRVAPDVSRVTVMIPAGSSPVTYEPSLSRMREASTADLYVSVGHATFAWETTWLADLIGGDGVYIIASADGCDILADDPHVWLSLPCARSIAMRIAGAVQHARPAASESVASSLAALLAEMDAMRVAADSSLGSHRGGSFIVLHPAWGYLAHEYGLQQMAILDHGSGDAGPAELAAIVATVFQETDSGGPPIAYFDVEDGGIRRRD